VEPNLHSPNAPPWHGAQLKESTGTTLLLPYHVKFLLCDINAKVEREDAFKRKIVNESLRGTSFDNVVRVVNFATSKYLIVRINISAF
jgi:hypothetical protein